MQINQDRNRYKIAIGSTITIKNDFFSYSLSFCFFLQLQKSKIQSLINLRCSRTYRAVVNGGRSSGRGRWPVFRQLRRLRPFFSAPYYELCNC